MAKHSYERGRWRRKEARKRTPGNGWWMGFIVRAYRDTAEWKKEAIKAQIHLDNSVHGCMSEASRQYRRQWRQAGRTICRLTALGDTRAEDLDPQPRRLGVMWDIW